MTRSVLRKERCAHGDIRNLRHEHDPGWVVAVIEEQHLAQVVRYNFVFVLSVHAYGRVSIRKESKGVYTDY